MLSQIELDKEIDDDKFIAALQRAGVTIGYPSCFVALRSEDEMFRLAALFSHYGYRLNINGNHYYEARHDYVEQS